MSLSFLSPAVRDGRLLLKRFLVQRLLGLLLLLLVQLHGCCSRHSLLLQVLKKDLLLFWRQLL